MKSTMQLRQSNTKKLSQWKMSTENGEIKHRTVLCGV
jgi:hypothetical protein